MKYDFITIVKLSAATLLPVLLSVLLYLAEKKTRFGKIGLWKKQILIGLLFGGVSVLATAYGIPIEGAVLNVRNAAPLTAGLLFGGPAGILSGVIGGAYRWFAVYFGAGYFSRLACTIGCVLAGLVGAACRKFMFDNKKASWFYGLAIGITTEVTHMLLVFLTNMSDIEGAFRVVSLCAAPMILCCGVSVMLSLLSVSLLGKERVKKQKQNRQISQVFQFLLLICVVLAFAVTCLFTNSLQTRLALSNADSLLSLNLNDVKEDIKEASDENLLKITRAVAGKVDGNTGEKQLTALMKEYNVAGINIIDEKGVIRKSTLSEFVGYDMSSGKQSSEFLCLLHGEKSFVQSYQPLSENRNISRKYAAVTLSGGGFVQVGYDSEQFVSDLKERIEEAVKNRHIGKNGGIIVCDESLTVIADNGGHIGESVVAKSEAQNIGAKIGERFTAKIGGTESYCMYDTAEGFYLISTIPVSEAMFSRNIAISILMFMEIIVFAALFAHSYFLIKRVIVDNIHKINKSLSQITDGDLNVHINVRENEEFASLSDDINATVDTLKHYISEAESRIDRELEFARQIQRSSLPSVFPPYPDRKDFSIFASMETAKEVGGDFYDFTLTDPEHLTFIVADVSGKGIPGALFMMRAKTLIKNLVESGLELDEVFTEANKKLCENNEAEMFVTAWMGRLNLESGVLEYVNAGHNPPLVRRGDGNFEYLRTKPNFILAGMDITRYRKHEIALQKGDEIFLYTDGVTEATDLENNLYGEQRLQKILSSTKGEPTEICAAVHTDIENFVKEAEQSDDITMMCVKLNSDEKKAEFSAVPDETSIERVTAFLSDTLEKWGVPLKLSNHAQIAVDEIYSNIVYYSKAEKARLTVFLSDENLTLVFADNGVFYDPTTAKEPDTTLSAEEREIGGLGIFMVKKLAKELFYKNEDGENRLTVVFSRKDEA